MAIRKPTLLLLLVAAILLQLAAAGRSKSSPTRGMTPKGMRERKRCLKLLEEAQKDLKCAILRLSLPRRISAARKCRYNGLPFSDYKIRRAVCRQRSDVVSKLRKARMRCGKHSARFSRKAREEGGKDSGSADVIPKGFDVKPSCRNLDKLQRLLKRTIRSCKAIGWVNGARDICPKIMPLKNKLKYIMWKGCGADGVEAAKKEVERTRERCDRVAGVVIRPSTLPRRP